MSVRPQSLKASMLSRIYGKGRGALFTPKTFLDLGNRTGIGVALFELMRDGIIRKVTRGVYEYPKTSSLIGPLPPRPEAVANAIAVAEGLRLQPTGAYAANLLGLSEQVPARITYFTDGTSKTIRVGKQTVILKRTTPRNMQLHGSIGGLLLQALRHLGQKNVGPAQIEILRKRLSAKEKAELAAAARWVPAWVAEVMRTISTGE